MLTWVLAWVSDVSKRGGGEYPIITVRPVVPHLLLCVLRGKDRSRAAITHSHPTPALHNIPHITIYNATKSRKSGS